MGVDQGEAAAPTQREEIAVGQCIETGFIDPMETIDVDHATRPGLLGLDLPGDDEAEPVTAFEDLPGAVLAQEPTEESHRPLRRRPRLAVLGEQGLPVADTDPVGPNNVPVVLDQCEHGGGAVLLAPGETKGMSAHMDWDIVGQPAARGIDEEVLPLPQPRDRDQL